MHIYELIKGNYTCYAKTYMQLLHSHFVQEWQSFMYLDIKFGGHPIQNDYKATMYTQPFVEVL